MLMHRIKKLSGLPSMLPHFRNMERYLKYLFGFCSNCFIHHNNGEVKQGVYPSSWLRQLEKHPPQTTKAGQRKADSDGRQAVNLIAVWLFTYRLWCFFWIEMHSLSFLIVKEGKLHLYVDALFYQSNCIQQLSMKFHMEHLLNLNKCYNVIAI